MTLAFELALCGTFLLPLVAALIIFLVRRLPERALSRLVTAGALLWLATGVASIVLWLARGGGAQEWAAGEIYHNGDYHFPLLFLVDRFTVVFLGTTLFLGGIIFKYCRYYLHREEGYARFFSVIFGFLAGMSLIVTAGTLDLLFAGWEIVGVSSFLLIGFYRYRIAPQHNATRAYAVYRLCDVGLLCGAWLEHLIWHETTGFTHLAALGKTTLATLGPLPLVGLSFLILLAASGKSAQFPFCAWLPRAMEGPTPSSAIFYGALSVHAGVFLLLRMYPLWHALGVARVMVGGIGILTAVVATLSGRVQSNIKAQIGYASIAQVGLMLVELALDLPTLVLVHFVANACFRCYQLLVSPSVVAHLLRVQASSPGTQISDWSLERRIPSSIRSTLYVLAFNEGYLENFMRTAVWMPVRRLARLFHGDDPRRAWLLVGFTSLTAAVAVWINAPHAARDIAIYLAGIVPSWALGWFALAALRPGGRGALAVYQGLSRTRPGAALALFFAVLGVAGFPCTPAFVGEDLLMHHTAGNQLWLAAIVLAIFVLNGIVMIRMYSRLCFGPPQWRSEAQAA